MADSSSGDTNDRPGYRIFSGALSNSADTQTDGGEWGEGGGGLGTATAPQ